MTQIFEFPPQEEQPCAAVGEDMAYLPRGQPRVHGRPDDAHLGGPQQRRPGPGGHLPELGVHALRAFFRRPLPVLEIATSDLPARTAAPRDWSAGAAWVIDVAPVRAQPAGGAPGGAAR